MPPKKLNPPDLSYLPINSIAVQDGFNPRTYFDTNKMQELTDSVRVEGVLQPIVVRPQAGGRQYWVVAGERRYRAAVAAGLTEIPAVIRELDDRQARLVATVENTQRDDMSPAEEAQAARDILSDCNGDRAEAIRLLGWSHKKFEARLLLLHASEAVLQALASRQIKLGHAELLSQLPTEFQNATLPKLLEGQHSVTELKTRIGRFARLLETAIFDTADCAACHHNSQHQATLFDEHVDCGKCANPDCFMQKTQDAVEAQKYDLQTQYAAVFLDTEKPPRDYAVVMKIGRDGVGGNQFEQGCKQCAHFGVVLSTSPDSAGAITEDCCFDLACHAAKRMAYQTSHAQNRSTPANASVPATSTAATGPIKTVTQPHTATAQATPGAVAEHIERFYRTDGGQRIAESESAQRIVNSYALYRLVSSTLSREAVPNGMSYSSLLNLADFVAMMAPLSSDDAQAFHQRMLTHLLQDHEAKAPAQNRSWAKGVALLMRSIGVQSEQSFVVNRAFLEGFTKFGVEGVLREAVNGIGVTFVDYYEGLSEKHSMAGLMKRKSADILNEVFGCGYDFQGFVPARVLAFLRDDKNQPAPIHAEPANLDQPDQFTNKAA
ncbi:MULTISPECIES: PRTRC system ParB family protein [Methylomonas]|uniref:ParB-like N-terminal domain-containing protein n=1 Tax=Methylomonas koyamae TaxID=702114 RepID=A0A177P5J9_9GAMM|nr:PRTRC system ParB family protein [Methylomonas koyamae]OAI25174.1 hypothetical protein A1355_19905 [Methylomonas koyamae]